MKIWKWIKALIITAAFVCLLFSSYKIIVYIIDGSKNEDTVKIIESQIKSEIVSIQDDEKAKAPDVVIDEHEAFYIGLTDMNPDAVGWITIPDSKINYPIVKSSDNSYYLNHNISNETSVHGSIFMDWKNEPGDWHTVLYGHNMEDGSMFGELKKYKNKDYLKSHPIIKVNLFGENTEWEIFSVSYTDGSVYCTKFADVRDFGTYIDEILENAVYDTGIEVDGSSNVLTLSTCTSDFRNARLAVHAVRIEGYSAE